MPARSRTTAAVAAIVMIAIVGVWFGYRAGVFLGRH